MFFINKQYENDFSTMILTESLQYMQSGLGACKLEMYHTFHTIKHRPTSLCIKTKWRKIAPPPLLWGKGMLFSNLIDMMAG